jgi:hypothetical protein
VEIESEKGMAHPYSGGPKSLLAQSHHEFSPMLQSRPNRFTNNVRFVVAPVPLVFDPLQMPISVVYNRLVL